MMVYVYNFKPPKKNRVSDLRSLDMVLKIDLSQF